MLSRSHSQYSHNSQKPSHKALGWELCEYCELCEGACEANNPQAKIARSCLPQKGGLSRLLHFLLGFLERLRPLREVKILWALVP